MSKKDKIAYFVTCAWLLFVTGVAAENGAEAWLLTVPIPLYWLYRFLNKDISFLNKAKESKHDLHR